MSYNRKGLQIYVNKRHKKADKTCWFWEYNFLLCLIVPFKNLKKYFPMAAENKKQVKLHAKYRALQNYWRGGKEVPFMSVP